MEEVLIDIYELSYFYNHQKAPAARPSPSVQPHMSSTVIPPSVYDIKDTKDKNIKSNIKDKALKETFPNLVL